MTTNQKHETADTVGKSAPVWGEPPAPGSAKAPKRVRAPLRNSKEVAAFLAVLCRKTAEGKMSAEILSKWASALSILARLQTEGETEDRITAIEEALAARPKRVA